MKVGSLFSGIGGLDLGLERAGMEVRFQVEIDDYCRRVLAKHWPNVTRYEDIKAIDWTEVEPVDLICGGFPCQPVSLAGKRLAQEDPRWLWPEFARCLRALRPRFALVENVPGLLSAGMSDVLGDLAALGYDAEWDCIPAAAVGAPHLRYRILIVAYPGRAEWGPGDTAGRCDSGKNHNDCRWAQGPIGAAKCGQDVADASDERWEWAGRTRFGWDGFEDSDGWPSEPDVGRVVDGFPGRVDRLRGLGNAVVPQVAEWIGRRIMEEEPTP
jgi:DNA (cytosine-5)-methyltransferase 1